MVRSREGCYGRKRGQLAAVWCGPGGSQAAHGPERGSDRAGVHQHAEGETSWVPPGRGAPSGTPYFSWHDRKPLKKKKSFLVAAPAGENSLGDLGMCTIEDNGLNGSSVASTHT